MRRLVLLIAFAFTMLTACSKKETVETDTVEYFKLHLKTGMDYAAITQKFGQPDTDKGSGIHIYVYQLKDGTSIWIGYTNKILYARHMDSNDQLIAVLL